MKLRVIFSSYRCPIASVSLIEKMIFPQLNCFCNFVKCQLSIYSCGSVFGFAILFFWSMYLFYQYHRVKVSARLSSRGPEENLSLAFLRFWCLLAFFGLWMHYFNVCLHCHIFLFSTSVTKILYASLLWRHLCLHLVTIWIIQETLPISISLT